METGTKPETKLSRQRGVNFSDPQFLQRLKRREAEALTELVAAYLPQILRAARGMGFSLEESEDLAQSVFAGMLEGLERFEARSHLRTYLFGIFYNKVAERLRDRQKERENDPIDAVMESKFDGQGKWRQPPVDIERELLGQEIRRIVQECLETIPQAQRIAFYLREVEEMNTVEICKKLEITATNLGVLLFRARNRLRACVERKGLKRG